MELRCDLVSKHISFYRVGTNCSIRISLSPLHNESGLLRCEFVAETETRRTLSWRGVDANPETTVMFECLVTFIERYCNTGQACANITMKRA